MVEETKSDEVLPSHRASDNVCRYPTCWRVYYYVRRILVV